MFDSSLQHLLVVSFLLVIAGGCSPSRTADAAGLLVDIARQDPPETVLRESIAYRGEQGARRADLYAPSETRAGLVLVPGAAERAMQDARLINFADALRRRGFCVLVPELAGADFLQVSARDAEVIADAARHLLESSGLPEIGMAALSYAVGPTIRAALRPDIRQDIGFILAIGGYHDIVAGITYLTTGAFRDKPGEPWRYGEIDRRAKWRFLQANTEWIADPAEARVLQEIARARARNPRADVGALAGRLGPEGYGVYALLASPDPERVPELIANLPPRIREEIDALNLVSVDLSRLSADLILVHGLDDPLVPHTESLSLSRAVEPEEASVYLLRNLQHVDLADPGAGDLARMLRAAYRVLSGRNAVMTKTPVLAEGARLSTAQRRRPAAAEVSLCPP